MQFKFATYVFSFLVNKCRAATFPAVAGTPALSKIRKAFSLAWQNLQTACSGLMKFLSGMVWLGEVCRDFTVFTETSAQCAAKGALHSDLLKI